MASLLFLALSLSISGLLLSDSLIITANQNSNNYLIYTPIHTFLFFLVPLEFITAIILLLLRVGAIPQSALFIKHFTMATQVLVSSTLLIGVPLMVHATFTEAAVPDTLKIVLMCVASTATVKIYFNSTSQIVGNFVPAFIALCISTGTFLLIDIDLLLSFPYQNHGNPLVPVPIQLFLLAQNCFNFLLAKVLLFLYISVPTDVPHTSIPAVLVKFLVETVLAMSFTTTGLIGFYMVVPLLVEFM